MRIIALDVSDGVPQTRDLELDLRKLASAPERFVAVRWQMVLDLVQLLRADGPFPEAYGFILGDVVLLSPANRANRVSIQLSVDCRDFTPFVDGLPEMHYRLKISRLGAKLTTDARSQDPGEAKRIILDAFGWSGGHE